MKKITYLILRSSSLRSEKYIRAKLNVERFVLIHRNNHTHHQVHNSNKKESKIEVIHPVKMQQSEIHFSSKTSWSKVAQTFTDFPDTKALFSEHVEEILNSMASFSIPETINRFKQVLEYNVLGGKYFRAGLLMKTYKSLNENATATDLKLACTLGWCLEMLQTYLVILDDIMDCAETRRKQLCWYKVKDIGLTAINDSVMIEQSLYHLLKKHFSHLDCYTDLVHLFHDVTLITTSGQSNDLLSSKQNVATFTREKYRQIVLQKSSYYTILMPVFAAMYLSGFTKKQLYDEMKTILLEIGLLFQIHDDIIDCFGEKEIIGKIGTDITENKCSWLAVECMYRANTNQQMIMKECYGSKDPKKIARVKQLYIDLDLLQVYANYEKEVLNKLQQSLNEASKNTPNEKILKTLNTLVTN